MKEYVCHYVVVRFFRNPLRDEAKNIGIIIQCPDKRYVAGRFEERLHRISKSTADQAIMSHYANWASHLSRLTATGDSLFAERELSPDFLNHLSTSTSGGVQFSEPRGCVTAYPDQALRELYELLVRSDEPEDVEEEHPRISAKSRTFPREFYKFLVKSDPVLGRQVRANLRIEIGSKKLAFDYGYYRPGNKGVALYETVDFSRGTFSNRIKVASPTIVKFGLVRDRLGKERTKTYAVVKTLTNGHSGQDSAELDILKHSADDVFNFYDPVQMSNLIAIIGSDFNGSF
jgi:hypothetical protein